MPHAHAPMHLCGAERCSPRALSNGALPAPLPHPQRLYVPCRALPARCAALALCAPSLRPPRPCFARGGRARLSLPASAGSAAPLPLSSSLRHRMGGSTSSAPPSSRGRLKK